MIYLDYAAATPLDPTVKKAMAVAEQLFANPSASYKAAREARAKLLEAKKQIGMVLGCKADEIVLTSGATEADNLAIFGLTRANRQFGKYIIALPTEHTAVVACLDQLEKEGFKVLYCPVDEAGLIKIDEFKRLINDKTILAVLNYASSEIGTIQPIGEIAKLVKQTRLLRKQKNNPTPLYFHSDASAAAGLLGLAVNRLGVDTMTINAAKIYGPKGSGALYVKNGTKIQPIIFGGGQEQDLRSGTENLAAAVGLAKALQIAEDKRCREVDRLTNLRDYAIKKIFEIYPKAILNGHPKKRLASNINVSFAGVNGEDLVAYFDAASIAVATGAACSESDERPSHVVLALGRSQMQAQGSLRVSLGRATTRSDIDAFLAALKQILANLLQ